MHFKIFELLCVNSFCFIAVEYFECFGQLFVDLNYHLLLKYNKNRLISPIRAQIIILLLEFNELKEAVVYKKKEIRKIINFTNRLHLLLLWYFRVPPNSSLYILIYFLNFLIFLSIYLTYLTLKY